MDHRTQNPDEAFARGVKACGSVKAVRCLIDALRAGDELEVARSGKTWVVRRPGEKPLVRRKTEENAHDAIESAQEILRLGEASCPPCDRPLTPDVLEERRRARVVTPQRPQGEAARYALIEAAELVPSHNPRTFDPDPRYPPNVQEREYHREQGEQGKVVLGAQNLDPSFVLTNTPTPMDGPPLVTSGPPYLALGGNGRSMMILRAYDDAGGARYRAALLERAADFGFLPADVEAFDAPVLVRVVEGLSSSSSRDELAAAVRRYNEGLTQALSPRARAVAEARSIRLSTLEALSEVLGSVGGDASLRDVMRDRPRELLAVLERDGVVTPQNKAQWATAAGLTDEGKDRLEGLLLGRVIGSGDRLSATAPALVLRLARAVPHLVRVAGLNPEQDLTPDVQAAVDLLNTAAAHGVTLAQLFEQTGFSGAGFGGVPQVDASPRAKRLAALFESSTPRKVAEHFAAWSARAAHDPRQPAMFWTAPTREEALMSLERGRTPNPCCGHRVQWQAVDSEQEQRDLGDGTRLRVTRHLGKGLWTWEHVQASGSWPTLRGGEAPSREEARAAADAAVGRKPNPGELRELRVVIQRAGRTGAGVDTYSVCLALVDERGKVLQIFSCAPPTKTAIETAMDQARRLARMQGLAADSNGILLVEADPNGRERLAQVLVTRSRTSEGLARDLVEHVPDRRKRVVVAQTPAGLLRIAFDGRGRPDDVKLGRRSWAKLKTALAADLAKHESAAAA